MKYAKALFFIALIGTMGTNAMQAQELNARVTVISNRISTQVDKRIFNTLQNQLANLLNTRKWTEDTYKPTERIDCNFVINLESEVEKNVYRASLTVQSARPVYNSTYNSPLLNWKDDDLTFRYVEFQPVEYNENRLGGSDPLAGNLTAVLGYYVNIILGLDYDSYSLLSGEKYYKKAMNIVNNAPQGRNISGWNQFDSQRNRYWLAENLTNNRYSTIHDIIYNFYRGCMDNYYTDENKARESLMNALNDLQAFVAANPNTMVQQVFLQSKSPEFVQVFKKASPAQKQMARNILTTIDITNAEKYRDQLK